MTHEEIQNALDDYVDGRLAAGVASEVELHLETCAECKAEVDGIRELLAGASALPRSIEPTRDLWPSIDARLSGRAWRDRSIWSLRYQVAAAAIVLVFAAAAASAWLAVRAKARPPTFEARDPFSLVAQWNATEREYDEAIEQLVLALELKKGSLSPETVQIVERNLRVIDAAIVESRAALAADPGNGELVEMLAAIYERKLDVLKQINSLETRL